LPPVSTAPSLETSTGTSFVGLKNIRMLVMYTTFHLVVINYIVAAAPRKKDKEKNDHSNLHTYLDEAPRIDSPLSVWCVHN